MQHRISEIHFSCEITSYDYRIKTLSTAESLTFNLRAADEERPRPHNIAHPVRQMNTVGKEETEERRSRPDRKENNARTLLILQVPDDSA